MTGALTIARHLTRLQVYLDQLRQLQQHTRQDLDDNWRVRATVERTLQLSIEVVISVCEQLVSSLSLPIPDGSKETIVAVAKAKIISEELANELTQAVGFRKVIVHQYLDIDYDTVFEVLQTKLWTFEEFMKQVGAFLKTRIEP
ncbi:MAG TPA: DUF86 domain-containing protein [Roseiflexaceae bacterium]|nr:DUF86 domain-containing protein [Roseiflexaceae bacterium]